jgi:hypothetical protein
LPKSWRWEWRRLCPQPCCETTVKAAMRLHEQSRGRDYEASGEGGQQHEVAQEPTYTRRNCCCVASIWHPTQRLWQKARLRGHSPWGPFAKKLATGVHKTQESPSPSFGGSRGPAPSHGTRAGFSCVGQLLGLRMSWKLIEPGHRNGWDASCSASAFKRAEGQANASHDCVPGALFFLRIFHVKAMNYTTGTAGKVASTVKDNAVTL